jgi:hypothetical protein
MRIPVFTSKAQLPGDAPGRPITARMRAEPFVQAELRKGEVVGEVLGQVQQYAVMRHKAAVEVQMSESLLAAEEEMMTLADQLKKSTDLHNVFKPDGTGTWSDTVTEVRARLADGIQSRSARNEFTARFNQSELSKRFQLKDAVDSRIKARAQAAAAARMQAIENDLSDPFAPPRLTITRWLSSPCVQTRMHQSEAARPALAHLQPPELSLPSTLAPEQQRPTSSMTQPALLLWLKRLTCRMRFVPAQSRRRKRMRSQVLMTTQRTRFTR